MVTEQRGGPTSLPVQVLALSVLATLHQGDGGQHTEEDMAGIHSQIQSSHQRHWAHTVYIGTLT